MTYSYKNNAFAGSGAGDISASQSKPWHHAENSYNCKGISASQTALADSCYDYLINFMTMFCMMMNFSFNQQTDGLRKVYDIFKSSSVDAGVKKSAVDQLAIILQDHNLHAAFKAEGGMEVVIKHIRDGLVKTDDKVVCLFIC